MTDRTRYLLFQLGVAVASVLLATWVRLLLGLEERLPFITYFVAVLFAAWYGGFVPGVVAVILSAIVAARFFAPNLVWMWPITSEAGISLALFVVVGVVASVLSESMHRARQRAEQERERFQVTLASIGDGVIVTDMHAKIVSLNSVAEQLTGWTQAEAKGQPLDYVFRIINEQTRQPEPNPVAAVLKYGQTTGLANHTILITKYGRERAIADSAAPILAAGGASIGVVLVFRDVTDQRHVDLQLSRLGALIDSSDDAIIGMTLEGKVIDWNSAAEQLFGFEAAEVLEKLIFETIVPPDRKDELLKALEQVKRGESAGQVDTVRLHKDGRQIWVSIRISPILDANGNVIGASAIDRDITQQRLRERRRNTRLAVTQILAQAGNVEQALPKILDAVCEALDWDVGAFWQIDKQTNALRCQVLQNRSSRDITDFENISTEIAFRRGVGLPGRVWETRRPAWIPDVTKDVNFPRKDFASISGLHAAFACPIVVGDDFLGAIEFFNFEIQEPDEDLLETMFTIGGQIGQFLERKRTEDYLGRSEQELADFFENAAVGLHFVGPDGLVQRVNQTELDMLGYTRDEYVGHHIAEFHVDQQNICDMLDRLKSGEVLQQHAARMRCKDGSIKHVLIDSNVLWEEGKFIHTRCFTRDVTDRIAADEHIRFQAHLLDAMDQAAIVTDADGYVTYWNRYAETLYGWKRGEALGRNISELVVPPGQQEQAATIMSTLRAGESWSGEFVSQRRDGSTFPTFVADTPIVDADGKLTAVVGISNDITERKRLEEQLRRRVAEFAEAEERIRSVVDNVLDGIITFDEQGIIQTFNTAAERIFGYTATEIIGENVQRLMFEPDLGERAELLSQSLRIDSTTTGADREGMGRRKDGSAFSMDLAVKSFHFDQRVYFTGIVRDITQRKRFETALRFLADASKSLATLVDYRTTLQKVSQLAVPGFADWCAVDIVESDGSLKRLAVAHADPARVELAMRIFEQYPPDPNSPHGVARTVNTGEPRFIPEVTDELVAAVARSDEHLQMLQQLGLKSFMCVPLNAQGRIFGALTFASTSADRTYTPSDLSIAEDLAHRATIAIENARLYQELRDADRRKDEFLAMLAHELRNPLAPIRTGLDVLAIESDEQSETVLMMQQQVEHLVRLVDDLLDVSRIIRGHIHLKKEPIDLSTVVNRALDAVRHVVDNNGQELTVSIPDEPIWLNVDAVRIVQVLENLLNNASKYSDESGRIELEARQTGPAVDIVVRDNGVGIEPDLLPKVFDLFTQSSRSLDRSQGGLGIGLTLVRSLVEMHGGTVSVRSAGPGRGSEFEVHLPIGAVEGISKAAPLPSMPADGRKILVVDDNVGSARVLSLLLSKLGPHVVEMAHDGPTALALLNEFRPQIVLLDIGLPGMDGYEVARSIRKNPEFNDVLLAALTGYGQEEDRRRSKEAGFDQHLVKPPALETIKELLSHSKLGSDSSKPLPASGKPAAFSPSQSESPREMRTAAWNVGNRKESGTRHTALFLRSLTHEVANAVYPFRFILDLLQRPNVEQSSLEQLRSILEEHVATTGKLVGRLRQISRILRGQLDLHPQRVDLVDVVEQAADEVRDAAKLQKLDLELQRPKTPAPVNADPELIRQVVVELLDNAIQHAARGGRVAASVSQVGDVIRLGVRDNGRGIPANVLPRIFDLFMRSGDDVETSSSHFGVGLTFVQYVVEKFGGKIEVSSREGEGSEFVVQLPIAIESAGNGNGNGHSLEASGVDQTAKSAQ